MLNAGVAGAGVPKHKFNVSADFTEGDFNFGLEARYIGVMRYSRVPTQFYTNNRLPSVVYLNANIAYDFNMKGAQVTMFATGSNLTDKFTFAPQVNAQPTEFYPTFQSQYDVIGRYIVIGLRLKI